jgi:hypothetical protein
VSRAEARTVCHALGGDLWSVGSEVEERDVLDGLDLDSGTSDSGRYWIGLNIDGSRQTWTGSETAVYKNFAAGEPAPGSLCASLAFVGNTARWHGADCASALPFVCERFSPFVFTETHHAYRLMTQRRTSPMRNSAAKPPAAIL